VGKKESLKEISVPSLKLKTCEIFLWELEDPRRDGILQFHEIHRAEIEASWGSKSKHQAWPGGYVDHLAEVFRMAEVMYDSLSQLHPLPFSRDSAVIVLYFHDLEKIWKYTRGLPDTFDKTKFLFETLAKDYGITFTPEEVNARVHPSYAMSNNAYPRMMARAVNLGVLTAH
jgi:hypothetical protein